MKQNQYGRSMIEMLGVLAIIGVLSVAGIAGYSKAMEKWKIDKAIAGYSYLTQGLLEHTDDIRALRTTNSDGKIGLNDTIQAMNLVPEGWTVSNNRLFDTTGNWVVVFSRGSHLVYDISLGADSTKDDARTSDTFSDKLCREFFINFVQPLHASLQYAYIFRNAHDSITFYGDAYCGSDQNCLRTMTLAQVQSACNSCMLGTDFCLLTLEF